MQHLQIIKRNNGPNPTQGKSLIVRATGRFYTPPLLGKHVAERLARHLIKDTQESISVIDPFCGDGRLIVWLLQAAAKNLNLSRRKLNVYLWDCDESAVRIARKAVLACARDVGLRINPRCWTGDSFRRIARSPGQFDVVVTNPPWELLKPDGRELQSLEKDDQRRYIDHLREQDDLVAINFPRSQPRRKFSGWGTNLARVGTEGALTLLKPGGMAGVVSPVSLLADQVSLPLRKWIFEEHTIIDLSYSPAEARLFEYVDQPTITLVIKRDVGRRKSFSPALTIFGGSDKGPERHKISIPFSELSARGFNVPLQFGFQGLRVIASLSSLPHFRDLEGKDCHSLWSGRELDETRYESYLTEKGEYPFIKGRMVTRFKILQRPTKFVDTRLRKIPESARRHRLVWRDVSRPSQKRRVHATLIPPSWVTGNSLHVAYFRDNDIRKLRALLLITASYAFEFQVRSMLATPHVSLGAVRSVHIPNFLDAKLLATLDKLSKLCLRGENLGAERAADVAVARLYGLSREAYQTLLGCFAKLDGTERRKLMEARLWKSPLETLPELVSTIEG